MHLMVEARLAESFRSACYAVWRNEEVSVCELKNTINENEVMRGFSNPYAEFGSEVSHSTWSKPVLYAGAPTELW